MDKLLAGAGGTLSMLTYDANGALVDVDGTNAPTVVVRDSTLPTGVAIGAPITGTRSATGTYAAAIPVSFTILDTYGATWTWPSTAFRTSQFEVVGSLLFSDAQLRAFDAELVAATYTPAKVRDVRAAIDDRFYRATGVSFTRQGRREYIDGDGSSSVFLAERSTLSLTSLKVGGTSIATTAFTLSAWGKVEYTGGSNVFPWGTGNLEVLYEHGFASVPADVQAAALRYARYLLVPGANKNDERVTTIQYDVGFARMSVAGRDGFTGIPEVDAVLAGYNYRGALA